MRILLDNNVPFPFSSELPGHEVVHCVQIGWDRLNNGNLVKRASEEFEVLITVDKNMRHQTKLRGLPLAVVVLDVKTNRIEELRRFVPSLLLSLQSMTKGEYTVLTVEP